VFSYALSKREATLRLCLQAKESEPKLTFELWKDRRVHAAKQATVDRTLKTRAERGQEIKKRVAENPFGLKAAGRPGDRIPVSGYVFWVGPWGTAGTRRRAGIGQGGVGGGCVCAATCV
jgi:hypothetical protein